MNVAVITSGSLDNMKGIMNYVHEKAKRLSNYDNEKIKVDIYLLHQTNTTLFASIHHKKNNKHSYNSTPKHTEKLGVEYIEISTKYGIFDSLVTSKVFKRPINWYYTKKLVTLFTGYDVIASHTPVCHYLALQIKRKYGIPVIATWHGSDINVFPYVHKWQFELVKSIIENVDINYFVSRALLNNSDGISSNGKKDVIYTGPSSFFFKLSDNERTLCRTKYLQGKKYAIGYVGNLVPVKNVLVLPKIFKAILEKIDSREVGFLVAGDGILYKDLFDLIRLYELDVNMIGDVPPDEVPLIMNALDVLILPSLHEGLGLVALEAYKCGANVVGSNIDGIPEVIGQPQNVFDLDDSFVSNISQRIVEILLKEVPLNTKIYNDEFSWEAAVEKEVNEYKALLGQDVS